jgi:hypothetical protein
VEINPCPECGAPEYITAQHSWLNNGDIIISSKPENRIVFVESENLDPLFRGMEQIIGTTIEHIVVSAARRAYRSYFLAFIPDDLKKKILSKEVNYNVMTRAFDQVSLLMGQGKYTEAEIRYEQDENDYDLDIVKNPYYLLFNVAAHAAVIDALTDRDQGLVYEELSPGEYKSKVFPSPHPEGLTERLKFDNYRHRDGDIELEKCTACGGPKALSGYEWIVNEGIIISRFTKRRMAFLGPQMLDPIFDELEAELGDTIPGIVVESQRRFTRSGFYTMDDITNEGDFRTQLALRGLGNLKQLEMKRKGMHMRLENSVLPLLIVGQAQGFFEMGFGVDSTADWELSEEGDLEVEVKPLSFT